jgi:hypothetical protein
MATRERGGEAGFIAPLRKGKSKIQISKSKEIPTLNPQSTYGACPFRAQEGPLSDDHW